MDELAFPFRNHDRVSHEQKGLGSVRCDPASEDLIVDDQVEIVEGDVRMVYVVWDDDRLPVEKVAVAELELLSPADVAISSGF